MKTPLCFEKGGEWQLASLDCYLYKIACIQLYIHIYIHIYIYIYKNIDR